MIRVENLTRNYGDFRAVNQVSFNIESGEVVGLLGHNGAGKTTIMKMLTGFLEPTSGTIEVDGLRIGRDTREIQKRIGYLPENCPLWPEMTVIDYLEFQAGLHGIPDKEVTEAVIRAIRRTALVEKAAHTIQTLSRGYRQRVGVAQAILHNPDIVILDEPTNGLDPTQIRHMRTLIQELAKEATVIVSTHILQEVQAVCERVLILRAGGLAVDSRLEELQKGNRLLVTLDREEDDLLSGIQGVAAVEKRPRSNGRYSYAVDAPPDAAPEIASMATAAGARLFALQEERHDLEALFAEVNEGIDGKEAARA